MTRKILSIQNLKVYFDTYEGTVRALEGVNLDVNEKETYGLVGETGCGKSVTFLAVMGLLPRSGRIVEGEIWFDGEELLKKSEEEMNRIRGSKISIVFQEPTTSLNPVFTVGDQVGEVFQVHHRMKKREAWEKAVEIMEGVKIPDPKATAHRYPHELSGGMQQRVMIAMAYSCRPKLLIADEPTSSLDVTIQAQILDLMINLRKEFGSSIIIITHNFGVIAETCDKLGVMYAGSVVEQADVETIFYSPKHPYTRGLLSVVPKIEETRKKRFATILGDVPDLLHPPTGCRFHPRCAYAKDICRKEEPKAIRVGPDHIVKCHLLA